MLITVSRRLQRCAQPLLVRQAFFNGFGYPFIIEAAIILLALHYGASDLQMGFIYAAAQLTGVAAVLAPLLMGGMDMSAIWSKMWWTRGLIAVLYLAIPLIPGLGGSERAWLVIAVLYAVCLARALGMTVYVPVLKALTPPREVSSTMARVMSGTQLGTLACRILSFFWLGFGIMNEHYALLSLIALGVLANSYTAVLMGRLPATGEMEGASPRDLLTAVRDFAAARSTRRIAILTLVQTAMLVLGGFTISFFRNVLHYDGSRIFLLMLIGSVVAIAATQLLKIIGERITSRLLLLIATLISGLCSLLWALPQLLPVPHGFVFYAILFSLTGIGGAVSATKLMKLQSDHLPREKASHIAIAFQLFTLAGAVASLVLVQVLEYASAHWMPAEWTQFSAHNGMHSYSLTFLVWAVLSATVWLLVRALPTPAERSLHDELSLLLPQNLYDLYRAYHLSALAPEDMRGRGRLVLEGVMLNTSALSQRLMRESMQTCETSRRYSALRMLVCRPQSDVLPEVLAEAADPGSPLRYEALTALGFMGCQEAKPLLHQLLHDPYPYAAANAAKSLLRLGDYLPEEQVLAIYRACYDSHSRWGLAAGLADSEQLPTLLLIINEEVAAGASPAWTTMLLQMAADVRGVKADMVDVLDLERARPEAGLELALADWLPQMEQNLPRMRIRQHWAAHTRDQLAAPLTALCRTKTACGLDRLQWPRLMADPVIAAGLIFLVCLLHQPEDAEPE